MTADGHPGLADVHAIAEAVPTSSPNAAWSSTPDRAHRRASSTRARSRNCSAGAAPWVYAHATELGAIRMGNGPKARIGFDLANVEQWKRDSQIRPPQARKAPRRRPRRNTISPATNLIPYEPSPYRA